MRRSTALLPIIVLLSACSAGVSTTAPDAPLTIATMPPSSDVTSSMPSGTPTEPRTPPPMTEALKAAILASTPAQPISLPPGTATPIPLKLETTPAKPAATLATRTPKLADAKNLETLTKDYGIALTAAQRATLEQQSFIVLPLSATTILPEARMTDREFPALFRAVRGPDSAKERTQSNSVLYTSDIFLSSYNRLYEELIKEVENTVFFPSMRDTSTALMTAAGKRLAAAKTDEERNRWTKVRDYAVVPHCLFTTAAGAPSSIGGLPPDEADAATKTFLKEDKTRDSEKNVDACIVALKLGASEAVLLQQVKQIYATKVAEYPVLFQDEFEAYAKTFKDLKVDFTQFTPRSHYTGTSLRRQYFRGMSWYIQVPFFLREPQLSSYAFSISDLLGSDAKLLADYQRLERTIVALVGDSDDLRPTDYLRAMEAGRGKSDPAAEAMKALDAARNPQVKSLGATYNSVGTEQTAEVLDLTKGMRFFSGKVLRDSTWTGRLTQGDERPLPGFTQKLPPMASSVQVMSLLGSRYAGTQIDSLPFVTPDNRDAVHQMMGILATETAGLNDQDWQTNTYHTAMWAMQGMFQWEDANRSGLASFMRGPAWEVKTLQTASGSWTELRHATLLYAKQSFAEMGAGWESPCDPGPFPSPAMGYVEPQPVLYDRLQALAVATDETLQAQGFTDLKNARPLRSYAKLLKTARSFTGRELEDEKLTETLDITMVDDPDNAGKKCTVTKVKQSDWETLRLLANDIAEAQPVVVEGDILQNKDKRAAIVADVHTGGDSVTPPTPMQTNILYEALGVPNVILALVSDVNGARAVIGFTYRHHEFTEAYGGPRKTDEDWQKQFYTEDEYDAFRYTDAKTWPAQPAWYAPMWGGSTATDTPKTVAPSTSTPPVSSPPGNSAPVSMTPGTGITVQPSVTSVPARATSPTPPSRSVAP